ncbi:calpain-1 catalytic subunit-like [Tachysurus vachellii]|uniref:calpain-1 catalytic subunit-like n=1 Tax=Tachysurus vachellii TaxID=175792 RepID=UPI00296B1D07|nr:calpain-1 catalytic subunit-like [Tachysurus vachellii]
MGKLLTDHCKMIVIKILCSSKEWDQVSPEDKAKLNYSADDGEFWMTYEDYIQRYSKLEICNLTPDTPSDDLRCWNACQFEGTWKIGTTAGGCLKLAGD